LNRVKDLVRNVESGGKFSNLFDEASLQKLDLEIRYEESLLLWHWKEKDFAKRLMKNLLATLKNLRMTNPDER
jgi:hypothetical protein